MERIGERIAKPSRVQVYNGEKENAASSIPICFALIIWLLSFYDWFVSMHTEFDGR